MLYIDYDFDLSDAGIWFDKELHLAAQEKKPDQVWGKLPPSWREGDMFKLMINGSGQVTLVKATTDGSL